MKPETKSQLALSITQAKAKMYEYNVPLSNHIDVPIHPSRLFILTIGLLENLPRKSTKGTRLKKIYRSYATSYLSRHVFLIPLLKPD